MEIVGNKLLQLRVQCGIQESIVFVALIQVWILLLKIEKKFSFLNSNMGDKNRKGSQFHISFMVC